MKIWILNVMMLLAVSQVAGQYEDFYDDVDSSIEEITIQTWLSDFDPYSSSYESVPEFAKARVPDQSVWDYPDLREADVSWMTRYERIIDTRQKMNMVLRYPKLSVFDLMLKLALMEGGPTIYSDREFQKEITSKEIKGLLEYTIIVDVPDGYGGTAQKEYKDIIEKEKLVKIQVMEDWIFDKKHGRMYPRIVALAIVYQPVVAGGSVELPDQTLFWIKYSDARPYFINAEVFNRNMAAHISMDHFFQARMFDSQIIKEPNVFDYPIKYYPEYEDNGLAALLKSEEIKNELFVMEHDLWEY